MALMTSDLTMAVVTVLTAHVKRARHTLFEAVATGIH